MSVTQNNDSVLSTCVKTICTKSMQNMKYLDVQNDFGRQDICVYLYPMNSIPFIHMNEISLRARKHSFTLKNNSFRSDTHA